MNLSTLAVLITVNFVIALLSVYLVLRGTRRELKKVVKRMRHQRNQDLRWYRDSLLANLRLEQAMRP